MENDSHKISSVQVPKEALTVSEDKVMLQRTWVFWENYNAKSGKELEWKDSIKELFSFNDIISFWQFWNDYRGSNPSEVFFDGERIRL